MGLSEIHREIFWVALIGAVLVTGGMGFFNIGKFFLATHQIQQLTQGIIYLASSVLGVFVFLPIMGAFLFEIRNKMAGSGLKPK